MNNEREIFYEMLREAFDKSGYPLRIGMMRNQYGVVNAKNFNQPRLAFDFLLKKEFLRINIYISRTMKKHHALIDYIVAKKR